MRQREGFHWFRRWRPTPQQERVLDALLAGKSNAEIAGDLGISQDGAKWHVSQLLGETGLDDRYELAGWWRVQRERVEARRGLWPLAGWLARFALAAPVVLLAVWLVALDPLSIQNESRTQASSPAPGAVALTATPPPPPSPTPVLPGAWVFDLGARSVSTLARADAYTKWLDEGLFVTQAGTKPVVVDAAGVVIRELPAGAFSSYPVQGSGRVLLWDDRQGSLSEFDVRTGESRPLVSFGPRPPSQRQESTRELAVAPQAGLLALAEARDGGVTLEVMKVDGSARRTLWTSPGDIWPAQIAWSPDATRLLITTVSRRYEASRVTVAESLEAVLVIDLDGRILHRRPTDSYSAGWSGPAAVLFSTPGTMGQASTSTLVDVSTGAETQGPSLAGLMCRSPDGRFGVYADATSGPAGRRQTHRVVELGTGTVVLESPTRTEIGACDWTSDSRRVVLSFGGK